MDCAAMKIILFVLCLTGCSFGDKKPPPKSSQEILSFHRGYSLWEEQLRYAKVPYDLEQVIQGIRAADRGELFDEENIGSLVKTFKEELIEKRAQENLLQAESFLQTLAIERGVFELAPGKLYYKTNKKGEGRSVLENDSPLVDYSAKTLNSESFSSENLKITLADTIQGFAMGVIGMLEGEERTLFIHPDLAYGNFGGKLEPNSLVIFEIKLKQIE